LLRKHQLEMVGICKEILAGKPINTIIASVTPGGGKSLLPVILAELLIPRIADFFLWVVPRNSLKYQGESDFINDIVATKHRIRAVNGNGPDPARGYSGYITTYQAIGHAPSLHAQETSRKKYIVFLDEPHHISEDSSWEAAIAPIIKNSVLTIYASGTLSRGDAQKIAFMEYSGIHIDLKDKEHTRVIKYSRSRAIHEKAIIPVQFHTLDGSAEWKEKGTIESVDKLSNSFGNEGKALFTALSTEYAYQLLDECLHHWIEHRKVFPGRLLIVAPNIEIAKEYYSYLQKLNIPSLIATSDDSLAARKAIEDTKKGVTSVLVSVAMAYEGLSIKPVTHIACLTHIRSIPWLEQCFARANRICEGKTEGYVFGPRDPRFIDAIRMIESEQLTPLSFMGNEVPGEGAGILPGETSQELSWEPLKSSILGNHRGFNSNSFSGSLEHSHTDISPSDQETIIKKQIRDLRRLVLNKTRPGSTLSKARIFDITAKNAGGGRKIDHMSIDELVRAWQAVRERFGGGLDGRIE
jgi:superfamily II DNA or RNA helicase